MTQQIKPRPDRKPGAKAQRFTEMLDPEVAMTTGQNATEVVLVENGHDSPVESNDRKSTKLKQPEGQPIRIDKGLWLRLKSLQLKLEAQGKRKTLMDLTNEALAAYLAEWEK